MESPDKDLDVKPADIGPETIDLCATQRAAVKAKEAEIAGLESIRSGLKMQLQMAAPGQKADIVNEIERINGLQDQAEAALSALRDLLDRCEGRFPGGKGEPGGWGTVPATPG
jgi:hypothetical protein